MAQTHVLVCQNADCKARGAGELQAALEHSLAGQEGVAVKPYMCFGACQAGPNVVVYPQKVWYSGVRAGDIDEISNHVRGGAVVARLTEGVDPSLRDLIYQLLDAGLF